MIAELDETQQQFGLPSKAGASCVRQPAASQCLPQPIIQRSQSHNQDAVDDDEAVPNLTDEPVPPRAIMYLEPLFSLERPVCRLEMDKRLHICNFKQNT